RALLGWLESDRTSRLLVWCFPDPAQFLPVWQWRGGSTDERRWKFLGVERSASEVLGAFCTELDAIAAEVHRTHVEGRDDVELVVLSPYGCRPAPRLFDPSTWLARRGYLDVDLAQVRNWLDAQSSSGELSGFDCLHLRKDTSTAFALGLGTIQLDPRLSEGDREGLADEISSALMAERDPEGRAPVQAIHRFTRRAESGRTWLELRLAFNESWRTDPSATLGGLRFERRADDEIAFASPFSMNSTPYAGDYDSSAPAGAPGLFFSTHLYQLDAVDAQLFCRPWKGSVPEIHADLPKLSVLHVAPTLLRRLGVESGPHFDAAPLVDRAR
ncbi:MAG: hypothetical protein JNM84_26410, partial [Planctomycetes bacterium]|nr:hypothetical protein [Planctomycetota bacterium]